MEFTNQQPVERKDSDVPPLDDRMLVKWLEGKEEEYQTKLATEKLYDLLGNAAQPRHASGNACIKLCFFIEQCRKSKSSRIQEISSSPKTCLDLFNFYIEWNEKNQHRSMRQVLELVAFLITLQTQKESADSVQEPILKRLISIINHQAAQPLVKPAFRSLECFLSKGAISLHKLLEVYDKRMISEKNSAKAEVENSASLDRFISEIFDWLTLQDVAPAAGRCLVTLFGKLRTPTGSSKQLVAAHALSWQLWIRNGLIKHPDALENVKNYLFPPLFKLDRAGSLIFLEDLNKQKPISNLQDQELSAHSLLQLAAIEVGKKSGLVEDPSIFLFQKSPNNSAQSVILEEDVIGPLLNNASDTVRSLAFSVLVSSSSSVRPFNAKDLILLQLNVGVLYADTDAKFRNDVLSSTKHLLERLRGSTAFLVRELQSLLFVSSQDLNSGPSSQSKNQNQIEETTKLLRCHEAFIQWYLEFLLGELVPTAAYQRHITALKAIILLLKSGILRQNPHSKPSQKSGNESVWPFSIGFFTSGTMRLLLDLLMDPFEDVRINASLVLKLGTTESFGIGQLTEYVETIECSTKFSGLDYQQSKPSFSSSRASSLSAKLTTLDLLKDFISRADLISKRTGRADYADGLARCYALLYSLLPTTLDRLELVSELISALEKKIGIAKIDLSQAVSNAPVHGIFAALNFVWESIDVSTDCHGFESEAEDVTRERWNRLQLRILLNCSSIWQSVKDVLCNDSPEGHLLEDLDEVPAIDTKDVLSYSFRAIHESSNLMRTMVSKIKENWCGGLSILPTDVFIRIGNLTFEQLSNLRHRGAFSTVALTFTRCCQLAPRQNLATSPDFDIIETWYKGAMSCILEQASTTRRSAGIPALISGILSNAKPPSFNSVLVELISLARQPAKLTDKDRTNLYQVHAMNCLKEIFKSCILGKRAESYITECLQLASDSLNSEIWAIRNCGLLLLRSLIDSLFGTSESKSVTEAGWDGRSIRLSYERYPSLPELLLKLLDTNTDGTHISTTPVIGSVESVFPALDIIRRAGPPAAHQGEIYKCVSMHLGSKIWHIREIAARTICTMMLHKHWLQGVLDLVESSGQSANRLHGVLMAVRFILEKRLILDPASSTDGLLDIASALESLEVQKRERFKSPDILAAYLEIYNTFAKIILRKDNSSNNIGLEPLIQTVTQRRFTFHSLGENTMLVNKHFNLVREAESTNHNLNSALGIAIARRSVYISAITGDIGSLGKILEYAAELNTDIALAVVDCVPNAWELSKPSTSVSDIGKTYIRLIRLSKSPEVTSAAISHLADTINKQFESTKSKLESEHLGDIKIQAFDYDIAELQDTIDGRMETPSLSNARLKISGAIPLFKEFTRLLSSQSTKPDRSYLVSWGGLLATAGDAHNDFETRHAAATALATFYRDPCVSGSLFKDEHTLPSLFALYDTLNDDDDDVRDLSAKTVSDFLGKSLIPLAARVELAKQIHSCHYNSKSYAWNVVRRMTGNNIYEPLYVDRSQISSAEEQFKDALKDDDSLFVEEEQNLFIDEIREAELWCAIFEERDCNSLSDEEIKRIWEVPQTILANWVLDGLRSLNKLLKYGDGPLGWSSKPAVFAICMRILLSAKSILRFHEGILEAHNNEVTEEGIIGDIVTALKNFVAIGRKKRVHERLLFEVDGRPGSPLY